MYIGGTGAKGMEQIVRELVANSADQFLAGEATTIKIRLSGPRIVVSDDGPGLPYDEPAPESELSVACQRLFDFHNSPTADYHAPHVHLGYHGVGLPVVMAFSKRARIKSWRNGVQWSHRIQDGHIYEPEQVAIGNGRGTVIDVTVDSKVMGKAPPRHAVVRKMMYDAVHLLPGLSIHLNKERYHAPGGMGDLAQFYALEGVGDWQASECLKPINIRAEHSNMDI